MNVWQVIGAGFVCLVFGYVGVRCMMESIDRKGDRRMVNSIIRSRHNMRKDEKVA